MLTLLKILFDGKEHQKSKMTNDENDGGRILSLSNSGDSNSSQREKTQKGVSKCNMILTKKRIEGFKQTIKHI